MSKNSIRRDVLIAATVGLVGAVLLMCGIASVVSHAYYSTLK